MNRRHFIQLSSLAAAGTMASRYGLAAGIDFPNVRIPMAQRKFSSTAVERVISEIQRNIGNKEIAWMFGNCFPNTLDTTVDFSIINNEPDTYVITGDIDAMWLRDSTAQVWPYLPLCQEDPKLQQLVKGVINRQVKNILLDPYANAFYKDAGHVSEWKGDHTTMKPGVHERKWEVDSLCYPIRLSYGYWKTTGDASVFNQSWQEAMRSILQTWKAQQRFEDKGPYRFQRTAANPLDSVPLGGYGNPVKPTGLICSIFRPSDDATIYPFLIPSNFFALESLKQLGEMAEGVDKKMATDARTMYNQLDAALRQYATVQHPQFGKIFAFEVDGFGNSVMMDDANIPSLLSLPYLVPSMLNSATYQQTRRFVLSNNNPYYFEGKAAKGIGGPHVGMDMIWPLSIIVQGITSSNTTEIQACLKTLQRTHANTGFMHEAFHKDDPSKFTRSWFAWANTLFGEFVWKVYRERKELLS